MRFVASGCSVTGPAHLDQLLPNQDSIALRGYRRGWIAAACDGLGSCPNSQHGSSMAGRALLDQLPHFVHGDLETISSGLHQSWLHRVSPYPIRTVATTCLWAVLESDGSCGLGQLGDGLVLFRSGGRLFRLTPERKGYGNQTEALWKDHQPHLWHHKSCQLSMPGDGVILMTDGVSDDLISETLGDFFEAIYQGISCRGRRRGREWLRAELEAWSTPMHGDDKSIVAIFRTE